MFVVKTDFPVACDSPDHLRPLGTRIDNNTNVKLIEEMESFFPGRKIFSLDLGCSGGQFVVDQFNRGHLALGIEGSDYSITHKRANWPEFHGKLLFTADLTKPFEIFTEGKPARFDVITAWEVLEHLKPEDLQGILTRIEALLDDDGIFFGSIATVECVFEGVRLHQSVFLRETWFQEILAEHFAVVPYPFKNAVNELWEKLGESFFFMCRKKKVRKLNLGCGGNRIPAWENHDAEVDISKPLPFADSSFNFVLAEHVLEHIHVHEGYRFFEEAYRTLKPGGVLRLCVPGVDRIFREYSDEYGRFIESAGFGRATRKGAVEAILFNHGHQSTWTRELLSLLLQAAGFAPEEAEPRKSRHAELRDVDGHWKVIGEAHNRLETIVMEAVKPGLMDLIETAERKSGKKKQVAIGLIEHMGDIVACEPVARHIRARHPDAEITWAVNEAYRELVDTNPHIDRTLSINCLSDWIRITESNLFDHVIDLHVNRRVCTVWGTVLQKKTGNPDVDVEKYFNYGSLLEAFCRGAGLPPLQEGPRVYIPDSAKQKVDNLALPTAFITMHGISNETCKDWPANKWMQFVRSFCGTTGMPVVEVGSRSICGPLSEDRETQHINLCGKLTILETAEVIRRSSLFVGIDSGPGHLANAVGTHGVILLGAYRIFSRYLPYSGDYANGKKAELLYSEKGPAANLPVEKVLYAVLKHFPGVRRKKEVMTKSQESISTERFRTTPNRESAPKLIAIYLPQFHPIPENDHWWGKGFTEWTNVAKAKPFFPGHDQPHRPGELGYYDLRMSSVRKAHAELAKESGIYGFCYYHYWFNGKLLLERPIKDVLKTGEPDFPFCLCWANENWTRRWDGGDHEILMEQRYSEQDDRSHIRYLAEYFRDPRYIRVCGRPLFLIYRANRMPDPLKTTRIWREEARRLGIGELYLCRVESFPDEHTDPCASGFDAAVEFQPDWTQVGSPVHHLVDRDCRIYRYGEVVQRMMKKAPPPYKRFPCVTPRWDNSPRWKKGATIFIDSTPELYERWLRTTIETCKPANPEENIVFLNAWNEWGEGNHLEPDVRFGRGYLEATRRALDTARSSELDPAAETHAGILSTLVASGKRAEAVQALERLVETFPRYAPAYNDLGVLSYESGNVDKALASYEKAVSLDSESATFRRNLADFLYVVMKRPGDALPHYEKALSLKPRDTETLLILGNIRAESGDFLQARECYLGVLEIDPSNELAGKMFDALEARTEEAEKRDSDTLVREARCLARRGRTDSAAHMLETLLSTCPDHAAAHNDLGNVYCLLQKADKALFHLERAVQLAPHNVGFLRDLADAHLAEKGDIEGALDLYNKALALRPDDIETLLRIGNVCAAKGLYDDARFFYVKVLAIEPCHAMAQENIEQLRKLAPSQSSTRRPKTLLERCRTHIKEGTWNESIVILEDLIAYHVEQNPGRDDPFTPHLSAPHHSFPRNPEDTADILPFGSRIASASNASATTLTLETNKRLNQEEIRQKKTSIASLPLNVEIASTNVCNIMPPCVHCWKHIDPHHGYLNRDARHIPQQFLTHLSPYISCADKVALHGAGEPLTCDYLFEAVRHVDHAASVGFASNGLLLNERTIEKILASTIHFIDFSIDAASPDTYQKIRHNDFNRLLCNIKNLVSLRNERGLRFPEVRINMCLMLENMSEIPAFVKLGKELDAAVVHLFHLNEGADYQCGWFHYKEQHCRLRPKEHDEYMRAGFAAATELGVNLLFSGKKYFDTCEEAHVLYNREVSLDRFWCSKPWDSLLVQTNGDLYNCCWQTQPVGTLRQQTFLEIWNSKMLQAIRRSTLNGTPHPICNNTQNPCPFLGRV